MRDDDTGGPDASRLLDELRRMEDDRPDLVPAALAALRPMDALGLLRLLLSTDAHRRAMDALHEPDEEVEAPPSSADAFADALDDAKRLGDALDSIDSFAELVAGTFEALSPNEVRLVLFERSLRQMIERRRLPGCRRE